MIGRNSFQSGAIQSLTTFHFAPSHCWNVTRPSPSWFCQVTLIEWNRPLAPRASTRSGGSWRCSKPQRTSSPAQGAMSEFLLRGANGLDIENAVHDAEIVIDAADPLL